MRLGFRIATKLAADIIVFEQHMDKNAETRCCHVWCSGQLIPTCESKSCATYQGDS